MENTALGFLGGFTGRFVEESLENVGLSTSFTHIKEDTRINVKIKAEEETEINGRGPVISEEELVEFKSSLKNWKRATS